MSCVLYEMLVGEPPYLGNTAQAVLGKIIQGLPVSATAARKSIPRNVDAAIRKALEKLPADRFTSAQDFSQALADAGFRHGGEEEPAAVEFNRWKRIAMTASGAAAVALLLAAWSFVAGRSPPASVMRQEIAPVGGGMSRAVGTYSALAPDGSSMVYALATEDGQSRNLWLKPRSCRARREPRTSRTRRTASGSRSRQDQR
ncbi:MAG: hypothetical protein GWN32_00210 [Gemmatimonadetes bacterium]|nr:hypothetical protein [Gemmatimonadota bacterium]